MLQPNDSVRITVVAHTLGLSYEQFQELLMWMRLRRPGAHFFDMRDLEVLYPQLSHKLQRTSLEIRHFVNLTHEDYEAMKPIVEEITFLAARTPAYQEAAVIRQLASDRVRSIAFDFLTHEGKGLREQSAYLPTT